MMWIYGLMLWALVSCLASGGTGNNARAADMGLLAQCALMIVWLAGLYLLVG